MNENNSLQTNDYYKNLNTHGNCSKCNIVLTQDNYKKGRTVCKFCYNNNVLRYYKKKFCSNSSPKSDASTQTDFSYELDSSNNQVRSTRENKSKKQASSNKQDCSNKQDISINNIIDFDPNLLCDKLREILSEPNMVESDYTMVKMILDELLRTKCIARKQYNAMCKEIGLV